jgi:hypothetical protein
MANRPRVATAIDHGKVVKLRDAGYSMQRVAEITGYSVNHCYKVWRNTVDEVSGKRRVKQHQDRLLGMLERIMNVLEPMVTGGPFEMPPIPIDDPLDKLLKAISIEAKLVGANAPQRSNLELSGEVTVENSEANKLVRDLAAWAVSTGAANSNGRPSSELPAWDGVIDVEVVEDELDEDWGLDTDLAGPDAQVIEQPANRWDQVIGNGHAPEP